jgi:hypothetical protein
MAIAATINGIVIISPISKFVNPAFSERMICGIQNPKP